VTARILIDLDGGEPVEDPIVPELRDSPVPRPGWLPWPALGSFLAGATVVRMSAFRAVGGFSPRLWLGGEEELLAADLAAAGWWLVYAEHLTIHHRPSPARDATLRRRHGIRNTLWFTWLRRPAGAAVRRTAFLAGSVPRDRTSAVAFAEAAAGLPWVLRQRRPVPARVERGLRLLEAPQRASKARSYVG
jgi:GT2 family glycosyltransferase